MRHRRSASSSQAVASRRPMFAVLFAGLVGLLSAVAPALAYTIYMKDGSRLIAREKYRIEGNRAYIILENGTRTFIAAAEIDVERSDKANVGNYGTALVLEDGKVTDIVESKPVAPPKPTLSDLVASGQARPQERPAARRPVHAPAEERGRTPGGAVDLVTLPRNPFSELDLTAELQASFRAQGLEEVGVFAGTQGGQPLVEVITSSEAAVFRALATAAVSLKNIRARQPERLRGIDLLLLTSGRERAGQFAITPALAADLIERRIEISQFFVQYVQF